MCTFSLSLLSGLIITGVNADLHVRYFTLVFFLLRFDCSSSDAMSTDHARSSSSIVMDSVSEPAHTTTPTHLSAPPPSITSPSLTSDTSTGDARHPSNKTLERHHDSSAVTMDRSHDSGRSPEATCCQQQPDCTDRWLGSCSDDEQETKRLEVYKENRRKRYTNALEQKLSENPRTTEYYSTS